MAMYPRPIVREPETEYQYDEQQRESDPSRMLANAMLLGLVVVGGFAVWALWNMPW